MGHKTLNLKNYRNYIHNLQTKLSISESKEQEIYTFIEDSFNSIEDDDIAMYKTFDKILSSVTFSMEQKMYASMLLLLCQLKCQDIRKKTEEKRKSFKPNFDDDDEFYDDDDGDSD